MIYFVQAGTDGPVKIGYSAATVLRLINLQASHHEELVVLRELPGNKNTERWLHQHFKTSKIRGEWFRYEPAMLTVTPPRKAPPPKNGTADTVMTVEQFRSIGSALWGWGWQTRMAQKLGLDARTVRHYAGGTSPIPGPVALVLRLLKQLEQHT